MFPAIKQVEERNVANEIEILLWSDRMDLVAFSNMKGEVALHRLSWARAWSLSPPKEGLSVKGMAWRPDGKVLAIAYSFGEILLINVENKNTVHKIKVEGNVTCIFWIHEKQQNLSQNLNAEEEPVDYMKYLDYSSKYLPELPPISNMGSSMPNSQDENTNSNLFYDQKELNLLIIGTEEGYLHISIFGQFVCAILNLKDYLGYKCSIINTHLTDDLSLMYITVKDEENCVRIVLMDMLVLKTRTKELFCMALKDGHLNSLITYLSNVIILIKESWETSLLEMDTKLSKYAAKVPDGILSADFLDLLMFGITSEEMQEFLLQDLGEKGLKKFGQVIEMCYANIQKLLLKHITKAGQNITYHLVELRGMARLEHKYKVIGLFEDKITQAIGASGAFLTKGCEMHQIINNFMINYKAFFRWLYAAIIYLMDEQTIPDMPKNTQQDIAHILEFLLNFDNIKLKSGEEKENRQFAMERLGQYLNDGPLTIQSDNIENLWELFLEQNECIKENPNIIKHYKSYSLIQQFKHLVASIENIFVMPKSLIAEQFYVRNTLHCYSFNDTYLRITKINFNNDTTLIAFLDKSPPSDGIYFLDITNNFFHVKCGYVFFKQPDNYQNYHQVLDVKFYSSNSVSVLLQENNANKNGILYQFTASTLRDKLITIDTNKDIVNQEIPRINGMDLGFGMQKQIEGMVCSYFAVSGCRRVSIVLSENRKKVRLFEMEAEEDDEEDADMTNSARESDTSMHEENSIVE